ncbi:MAG TPA: 4-hydroxythreonine-4-phosphate dehydrogenase PdxA [Thermoanaerobaculia bacterium]|nr:4-hydroxythreonine-4-phosphate dehydrogenase PdxA [Thermoanaerobaculia bacterium]
MKPVAITLGDPAGIGPEVVLKAIEDLNAPIWLFGCRKLAEQSWAVPPNVRFRDVRRKPPELRFGEVSADFGRIALDSIDEAVTAIERGECGALVTAPINKQSIALAGCPFPGHTELLAARAGLQRYAYDYAMYFDSPLIRTVLLTVHVPLAEAILSIDPDAIAALAALTTRWYSRMYGQAPRIRVAAVNPHAGEGGRFGTEEKAILEGVEKARSRGMIIDGPASADTAFLAARERKYDVIMSMYHDQGLIAVKTLDFEHSVNVTIGLPYLRCSVDHGTAFDIAGKRIADARPMRYAIEWAVSHAARLEP